MSSNLTLLCVEEFNQIHPRSAKQIRLVDALNCVEQKLLSVPSKDLCRAGGQIAHSPEKELILGICSLSSAPLWSLPMKPSFNFLFRFYCLALVGIIAWCLFSSAQPATTATNTTANVKVETNQPVKGVT